MVVVVNDATAGPLSFLGTNNITLRRGCGRIGNINISKSFLMDGPHRRKFSKRYSILCRYCVCFRVLMYILYMCRMIQIVSLINDFYIISYIYVLVHIIVISLMVLVLVQI